MGNLGWPEILIILVIALIVFGPRKLPELGKSLGASLAQFRRASEDFKRTWEDEVDVEKKRLDAPPTLSSVPEEYDNNPATSTDSADGGATEADSTVAPVGQVAAAGEEGEVAAKETRSDWM